MKQNVTSSPKKMNGKLNIFSHIKYEHMVAGISGMTHCLCLRATFITRLIYFFFFGKYLGGVTSTLILHPLDLIKIRFAGESIALLLLLKLKQGQ